VGRRFVVGQFEFRRQSLRISAPTLFPRNKSRAIPMMRSAAAAPFSEPQAFAHANSN